MYRQGSCDSPDWRCERPQTVTCILAVPQPAVRGSKHIKFCLVPSPVSPPTIVNRTDYAERRTRYASASGQAALHQHSPNVQTGLYIYFSPRRKTATEDDSLQGPSHIFNTDLTPSQSWRRHNRTCVVTCAAGQSGSLEWTQAFNYHTVSTPSLVEVAQQICLRTQQQPQPDPRDFTSLLHPREAAMQVADSCTHPNATVHRHEHPPAATLLFSLQSLANKNLLSSSLLTPTYFSAKLPVGIFCCASEFVASTAKHCL